jgi:hypothetical protein
VTTAQETGGMALPKFLCIGAQKAGTTWLHKNLNTHPEIFLPQTKELHFFDYLFCDDVRDWVPSHIRWGSLEAIEWHIQNSPEPSPYYLHYLAKVALTSDFTEEWYRYCFSWIPDRISGDITPEYCQIGLNGINYAKKLLPDVKIIYVIREPLSRVISQLKMNLSRFPIDGSAESWAKAISDADLRRRGLYSKYIPDWRSKFNDDEILFIPFGEIKKNSLDVLRSVESFIGVSAHSYSDPDEKVYASDPIEIPAKIIERLLDMVDTERRFLRSEFGDVFYGKT